MKQDKSQFLPLSPASLHILLALAREDLHGTESCKRLLVNRKGNTSSDRHALRQPEKTDASGPYRGNRAAIFDG